jgi:hypothetical protein
LIKIQPKYNDVSIIVTILILFIIIFYSFLSQVLFSLFTTDETIFNLTSISEFNRNQISYSISAEKSIFSIIDEYIYDLYPFKSYPSLNNKFFFQSIFNSHQAIMFFNIVLRC